MSRGLTYLLVFVLLSVAVSGFTAEVSNADYKSDEIYADEVAELSLNIKNDLSFSDSYQVYTLDPNWIIGTKEAQVLVQAGEEETFNLIIDPKTSIEKSALYSIELIIKSRATGDTQTLSPEILIKSEYHRTFYPAVSVTARVGNDSVVDPRKGIPIRLLLRNQNALDLEGLEVGITSNLIDDSYTTNLGPNDELIKHLNYDLDPYITPQNDTIAIKLYYDGKMFYDKRVKYSIQKNHLFFSRDVAQESRFLYDKYEVTLTNNGNILSKEVFTYEMGFLDRMFTKTEPESRVVDGKIEFDVELEPSANAVVVIETNYRTTFFAILAALLVILLLLLVYFTFRSPIVMDKHANVVGERDGGTSEIKILINVKNRSSKVMENIRIIDRIPGITEIEQEFSIGTLKPKKVVKHPKKGTLIKWEFPAMEAFEERIITYRIHSKLGILGDLNLPQAIAKFSTPEGMNRVYKSNSLSKKD